MSHLLHLFPLSAFILGGINIKQTIKIFVWWNNYDQGAWVLLLSAWDIVSKKVCSLTLIHVCGVRADPRGIPQVCMWLLSEFQNQESTKVISWKGAGRAG